MVRTTTIDAVSWVETAPNDGSHIGKLQHVRVEGLEPGRSYRYRLMQQAKLNDQGNRRVVPGFRMMGRR